MEKKPADLTPAQFAILERSVMNRTHSFYTTTVTGTVAPQTAKALEARGYVTEGADRGLYQLTLKAIQAVG